MKVTVEKLNEGYVVKSFDKSYACSNFKDVVNKLDNIFESEQSEREFEVGDRVYCAKYGDGSVIEEINGGGGEDEYGLVVEWDATSHSGRDTYTKNGEWILPKYRYKHPEYKLIERKLELVTENE